MFSGLKNNFLFVLSEELFKQDFHLVASMRSTMLKCRSGTQQSEEFLAERFFAQLSHAGRRLKKV